MTVEQWWRTAVWYEVYPRSFADSNQDGIGDLPGICDHLDHIAGLGIDVLWLTPIFDSPMVDGGYDVADYYRLSPAFGTIADLDRLVGLAHGSGIKIVLDLVPNHTSDRHPWFRAALAAPAGSRERDRYIFRPLGDDGAAPNDWRSAFGGPAWTRVPTPGGPDQFYLHLFDPSQPDLNWENQEVQSEFEQIMSFWFNRGIDGFRIDMAHALFKEPGLPDAGPGQHIDFARNHEMPFFDRPPVHDLYRRWRRLAELAGNRALLAEVAIFDPDRQAAYVRPDELHQAFDFSLLEAPFDAYQFRCVIDSVLAANERVGASPTWVLSSHDSVRAATRYGGGEHGLRRSLAAVMLMLALPGACCLFQGEELGLEQVDLPRSAWRDPEAIRSGQPGRDGARVPLPWTGTQPNDAPFGFCPPGVDPWLPVPAWFSERTVERQLLDPGSPLALVRQMLAARPRSGQFKWLAPDLDQVLAFRRGEELIAVTNFGSDAIDLRDIIGPAISERQVLSNALAGSYQLQGGAGAWIMAAPTYSG